MTVSTILIQGIQGTQLVNTNTLDFDTIWPAIQNKYETIYDWALKWDWVLTFYMKNIMM